MKRNLIYLFALLLTLCLPVLGNAEVNRNDLEGSVLRGLFEKQPYQKIWELVEADDGEGLRAYLTAHQDKLTEDDFMVVWKYTISASGIQIVYYNQIGGEHIYCHAARENKMNAGKVLIDFKYRPEVCTPRKLWIRELIVESKRLREKYSGKNPLKKWGNASEYFNPELACYALKNQQVGFDKGHAHELINLAIKGGCEEEFIMYRNDLKDLFPYNYGKLTAPGWLALAKTRPELVSTPNFQKYLLQRIAAQKDSWFEVEQLKQLLLPENGANE